ncbi:esterase-like activity of phytase family protein [Emcibacter sp.]|uniref:esterase-like activity of phytase family protein n=1 Tax=Emcibacter sp. TaxID=1979954 RepID=UPI002AA5E5D9|nr:esterase-like activity of phytase family protein [Emcibacter sp.]
MTSSSFIRQFGLLVAGVLCSLPHLSLSDSLPAPTKAQGLPLEFTLIPLNHKNTSENKAGELTYLGGLQLSSNNYTFGGISGFVVSPGGEKILAVSDRGYWFLADVEYENGQLIGLQNGKTSPIADEKGEKTLGRHSDAEAVTLVDSAGLVVSFENDHRLRYYQASSKLDFESILESNAQVISFAPDLSPALQELPRNLGVEALTTMTDGRLLAISEAALESRNNGMAKAWIVGRGSALPLSYELTDLYRPTDMATLPNGDILVLERHFSLAKGMASRLRRIKSTDIQEGTVLRGEVIACMEFPYNIDNMEALAVRRNEAGETIIYMMSDNNYNPLQRNLLMMFRLDEPQEPKTPEQQIAHSMGLTAGSR